MKKLQRTEDSYVGFAQIILSAYSIYYIGLYHKSLAQEVFICSDL